MTTTTNLALKKPDYSDHADIAIINENMDTLDRVVSGKQNSLTFDTAPIMNSANPVTSNGVYKANDKLYLHSTDTFSLLCENSTGGSLEFFTTTVDGLYFLYAKGDNLSFHFGSFNGFTLLETPSSFGTGDAMSLFVPIKAGVDITINNSSMNGTCAARIYLVQHAS